jgi:Flp pilus assembly protein TadB
LLRSNNENERGYNPDMKKLFGLLMIICLAIFCSCQKQQTDEERNTEVERQVQERLAAERQAQSEQQLAQREADRDASEKELAGKQQTTANASVIRRAIKDNGD